MLVKEDDFKEVGSDEDNDYDMDVEPDNQKISHPHTVDYSLRYRGEINSFTCSSYVRGWYRLRRWFCQISGGHSGYSVAYVLG